MGTEPDRNVLANLPVRFEEFSGLPGTPSFAEYFEVFQAKANGKGLTKQETGTALMAYLRGPALSFVNSLPKEIKCEYEPLLSALHERFSLSEAQATRELAKARQKPLEAVEIFADRVARLVNRAYAVSAGYTVAQQDKIKLRYFLNGLQKEIKRVTDRLANPPETMQEAIEAARKEELLQQDEKDLDAMSRDEISALIEKTVSAQVNNITLQQPPSNEPPPARYLPSKDHHEYGPPQGRNHQKPPRQQFSFQPNRQQFNFQPDHQQFSFQPNRRQFNFQPNHQQHSFQPNHQQYGFQPPDQQYNFQPNQPQYRNNRSRQGRQYSQCNCQCNNQGNNRPRQWNNPPGPGNYNRQQPSAPQLPRPQEQERNRPSGMRHNAYNISMPLLMVLALLGMSTLGVSAFQVCNINKGGGHFVQLPQQHDCVLPPNPVVYRMNVTIRVPSTEPTRLEGHACVKTKFEVSSSSSLFGSREPMITYNEPVAPDICRLMAAHKEVIGLKMIPDRQGVENRFHTEFDLHTGFSWTSRRSNVTAYFLTYGNFSTLDGRQMASSLADTSGCEAPQGYCLQRHYTLMWTTHKVDPCYHKFRGNFTAYESEGRILIHSLHTALTYAQPHKDAYTRRCYGEHAKRMSNDVILTLNPIANQDGHNKRSKRDNSLKQLNEGLTKEQRAKLNSIFVNYETGIRQAASLSAQAKLQLTTTTLETTTPTPTTPSATTTTNRTPLPSFDEYVAPFDAPDAELPERPFDVNHTSLTAPLAGDADPINSRINAKVLYGASYAIRYTDLHARQIWTRFCTVYNRQVGLMRAVTRLDPTAGIRLWLERDDVVAQFAGEVLHVVGCTQVKIAKVYHSLQTPDGKCYRTTPALANDGTTYFINPGTRELLEEAPTIPCSQRPPQVYKHGDSFFTIDGPVQVVEMPDNSLYWNKPNASLRFDSPSIFFNELKSVVSIATSVSSYNQRISDLEKLILDSAQEGTRSQIERSSQEGIGYRLGKTASHLKNVSMEFITDSAGPITDFLKELGGTAKWIGIIAIAIVLVLGALFLMGMGIIPRPNCWERRYPLTAHIEEEPTPLVHFTKPETEQGIEPEGDPGQATAEGISPPRRDTTNCKLPFHQVVPGCFNITRTTAELQPYIHAKINGKTAKTLVDSGSSISYCTESLANELRLPIDTSNALTARVANGSSLPFLGKVKVALQLGKHMIECHLQVTADHLCPADALLGTNVLRRLPNPCLFDFASSSIQLGNQEIPFVANISANIPNTLYAAELTTIPPRHEVLVPTLADPKSPIEEGTILVEPHPTKEIGFLQIARSVHKIQKNKRMYVRMFNPTQATQVLYNGQSVAQFSPVFDDPPVVFTIHVPKELEKVDEHFLPEKRHLDVDLDEFKWFMDQVNLDESALSPEGKEKLKMLIYQYKNAFVGPDGIIGHFTGKKKHRIDLLPNTKPVQLPLRRIPLGLREEVRKQIQDMLDQKIIQQSDSPFAAPIVMVKKKDGNYRFAIDYRLLNEKTVKAAFVLPNISEILDDCAQSQNTLFTCTDLQSGFHAIDVLPAHRERTAFATFLGLFEFLRLPFGLCGAPKTFQTAMEELRRYLSGNFFIYLDDIILASANEPDHLRDLQRLFEVAIHFGLKFKLQKCKWATKEIKYLGFIIGNGAIRPDPKGIEAVTKIPVPKSMKELRSFIGAMSYFRRYISHFAEKAKPLYDLLKGNETKMPPWKEIHQEAFDLLKSALVSAPVLRTPIPNRPFLIETDASAQALGACLLQEHEKEVKPVAYASRVLNKHEKNYPSVEGEALAIVYALNEFRPYIEGNGQTVVRTDNEALTFLLTKKQLPPRLARFQLIIQSFNVKICHRSGKSNVLCDYLSRYPYLRESLKEGTEGVNIIVQTPPRTIDLDRVRESQKEDTKIRDIFDFLTGKTPTSHERHVRDKYIIMNGCVYVKSTDEFPDHRLLIPYPLRAELIEQFHTDALDGAHLGAAKTLSKMTSRVFWTGLGLDVKAV
uniref:RNA-directed DNA polymerase n=1 Tax=Steinernema glaseri TaxID=37863 RepID=A0A1I7ZZZ8_9BILA